jgi:hypothetical protein
MLLHLSLVSQTHMKLCFDMPRTESRSRSGEHPHLGLQSHVRHVHNVNGLLDHESHPDYSQRRVNDKLCTLRRFTKRSHNNFFQTQCYYKTPHLCPDHRRSFLAKLNASLYRNSLHGILQRLLYFCVLMKAQLRPLAAC